VITVEWEVRGFGVIERIRQPGMRDKLRAVTYQQLNNDWRRRIHDLVFQQYRLSLPDDRGSRE
jgi:hypothetical protein